MTTISQTPVV